MLHAETGKPVKSAQPCPRPSTSLDSARHDEPPPLARSRETFRPVRKAHRQDAAPPGPHSPSPFSGSQRATGFCPRACRRREPPRLPRSGPATLAEHRHARAEQAGCSAPGAALTVAFPRISACRGSLPRRLPPSRTAAPAPAQAQPPLRNTGTREPSARIPSISVSGPPIIQSTWIMLWLPPRAATSSGVRLAPSTKHFE